jgi:F-actin monooxygenase
VGDSLLEPFWPQGLGSNRGFHSALDAAHAVRVLRDEGLDAALLERCFAYDAMLQSSWSAALLKPARGWSADPVSRYKNGALLDTMRRYTSLASKRLFKGAGAVPPRIAALKLQREK